MNNISIKLDATAFKKYLKDAPDKVQKAIGNVVKKVAFLIEREGKIRSPVDTGRLRASIATDIHPLTATVQTNTKYAVFVHEGTRFMTARPFMAQGAHAVERQVDQIVLDELKVLE